MLATDLLLDPFGATWAGMREAALAAERAGFDGIWTWDHLAGSVHGEQRVLECWTVLSALAPLLERVNIGPLVLNVANRHPGIVATMAATLQEVTGGRLLLGIGAGGGAGTPYGTEQSALGRPVLGDIARRRQVAEAIGVIRQLWTGRATPLDGRYFQLGSAPGVKGGATGGVTGGFLRPDPPPPIIVGAFGPKMAALAGRLGDGLNTQAGHPLLDDLIAVARKAHAGAGKDPEALITTAFAGLDRRWVEDGSHDRERLKGLRVRRLVLLTHPPFDPDLIAAAGRLLPIPTP